MRGSGADMEDVLVKDNTVTHHDGDTPGDLIRWSELVIVTRTFTLHLLHNVREDIDGLEFVYRSVPSAMQRQQPRISTNGASGRWRKTRAITRVGDRQLSPPLAGECP